MVLRGFFAGRELESGEIVISDLRMGLEERFVFAFVVGRRTGQGIEPAPLRAVPSPGNPPGWTGQLWDRMLARSSHPACILGC